MRITKTDNYDCGENCVLGDTCERHYCHKHRLLYRDCDTAYEGEEGDRDVIGGTRILWYSDGECPEC